jgi:hypothetical protein
VYDEPSADLAAQADRGEIVIGGGATREHGPAWSCPDCGKRFGELHASGGRVVSRTRAEWTKLIRTMLPKPVKLNEYGELVGGRPQVVAVRLRERVIEVLEAGIGWEGVLPAWRPRLIAETTFDAPAIEVAALIARAWSQRVSRYRWCPRCRNTHQPEHMMQTMSVCQGCATKYFRVVF